MQKHVEGTGFSVVTSYVGHGIGRIMHENPQVPNYVDRETRKADFRLEPGLTLAVEPMVNMRRPEVDTLGDQWTVVTRDRLASVHVEHTLALTANGVFIITADEGAFDDEPTAPAAPRRNNSRTGPCRFSGLRYLEGLPDVYGFFGLLGES